MFAIRDSENYQYQNFKIDKKIVSKKGDPELTKLMGEENISYIQFELSLGDTKEYLLTTVGASGAKYIVIMQSMGKFNLFGSSAFCK